MTIYRQQWRQIVYRFSCLFISVITGLSIILLVFIWPPAVLAIEKKIVLKMPVFIPTSYEVIGSSAIHFAEEINRRSGTIKVEVYEPGKIVSPYEISDAVSKGKVNAGWTSARLLEPKIKRTTMFSSSPFSPSAEKHYDWMMHGGGIERYQKMYEDAGYRVKVIPGGMQGPAGFGWFVRPLNGLSDLKGLKMRISGPSAYVVRPLGTSVISIPASEIYMALERGVIDAAVVNTPYFDRRMRLERIVKNYYYPGWQQSFAMFDLLINRDTWNGMSAKQRKLIEQVCRETVYWGLELDARLSADALSYFKKEGVVVSSVPESIVNAASRAWKSHVDELSAKSAVFKENYAAYTAYLSGQSSEPSPGIKFPDIDLIPLDEEYEAVKKANVRENPDVTSRRVAQLAKGEKVNALGKVNGENWILIARSGKPTGYVVSKLLKPAEPSRGPVPPADLPGNGSMQEDAYYGNYHALVIGNKNYQHLKSLGTPMEDAREVGKLLRRQYGFQVKVLFDATRAEIISSLVELRAELTELDNLLIYYAGHGIIDNFTLRGYWQPVDAQENDPSYWVSNEDIINHLSAMRARHVLVVSDSCFSGTLTRSPDKADFRDGGTKEWVRRMAKRRSRTALTSGGNEPVLDSGGGKHSVFAQSFLKTLGENQEIIDMDLLSKKIRHRVVLNAKQTPRYSNIPLSGHDDGDFIFVPD